MNQPLLPIQKYRGDNKVSPSKKLAVLQPKS